MMNAGNLAGSNAIRGVASGGSARSAPSGSHRAGARSPPDFGADRDGPREREPDPPRRLRRRPRARGARGTPRQSRERTPRPRPGREDETRTRDPPPLPQRSGRTGSRHTIAEGGTLQPVAELLVKRPQGQHLQLEVLED